MDLWEVKAILEEKLLFGSDKEMFSISAHFVLERRVYVVCIYWMLNAEPIQCAYAMQEQETHS